jgi:hypothetical protein
MRILEKKGGPRFSQRKGPGHPSVTSSYFFSTSSTLVLLYLQGQLPYLQSVQLHFPPFSEAQPEAIFKE